MTQALRRQQRLLFVRSLQADFAAAELRRLQADAATLNDELSQVRELARPAQHDVLSSASDAERWNLSCAEQELALMDLERRTEILAALDSRILEQTMLENRARQEREQIKRVCERQREAADYLQAVRTQNMLDDLFTAGLLRKNSSR